MTAVLHPPQTLNLNASSNAVVWGVTPNTVGTVQATARLGGTWGTAVITLKRSNDGRNWYALSSPQTIGPGSGMSDPVDLDFAFLSAEVTTAEGSALEADVVLCAKGDA